MEDPQAADPERRAELRRETQTAFNLETATSPGPELNNRGPTPASANGVNPQETLIDGSEDSGDPHVATAHSRNTHSNNIERRAEPGRNTQGEAALPLPPEGTTGVASEPQPLPFRETHGEDEIDDEEERTVEEEDSNNAAKPKNNSDLTEDNDSRAHPPFSHRAKMRVKRLFPWSGRWSKKDTGRSEEG